MHMHVREVKRLSVVDLLTVAEDAKRWLEIAATKSSDDEEQFREILFNSLKLIFVGPPFGGMDPAHDPDGSAQYAWKEKRDKLVREVAIVSPWHRNEMILRAGPMVASKNEVPSWSKKLTEIGLDWKEIDQLARTYPMCTPNPKTYDINEERLEAELIVHELMKELSDMCMHRPDLRARTKKIGVGWDAIQKKSNILRNMINDE